ncbi:MAG: thiamine phosphate synthase [Hyphomicrobiales bacterium]|nr:thiamine phosphate synthase [Hyphomicrobiales bacterium]
MIALDRFYPIVENADWVGRIVGAGARLVQLRAKDLSPDEARREIVAARDICAAAGAQLVVNDYWALAIEERCDFVHLGQGDLDTADIHALYAAGIRLGVSTHDHAELQRALALDPDYIALGPIYPTLLKQMPFAPQGLERIGEWKSLIGERPLVAIGGLTIERARLALAAGADSAAVVTDIVRAADPQAQTRAWLAALDTPAES